MKKILIVRLTRGRRRKYSEHLSEWNNVLVENGSLIVIRDDGTRDLFAPGRWTGFSTRMVDA